MTEEKSRSGYSLDSYLKIAGGSAGILTAVGYLSVASHNHVLGVQVDITAQDLLYQGGMFFFNSLFAMLLAVVDRVREVGWILPAALLITFLLLFTLKKRQIFSQGTYPLLWILMALSLLVEALFILSHYVSLNPGSNMLFTGVSPHNQEGYGCLVLMTLLYGAACWQLISADFKERAPLSGKRFITVVLSLLMGLQSLILIAYHGGLSHPNEYPIALLEYGDGPSKTLHVALLGERYGRWVAYDYPLKRVILLDKNLVRYMELEGRKMIFNQTSYLN
ncbi:MAG: hypothetical protein KJ804_08155 [Proteobacteria bacterium]|nr:hypothetical protein [Pseudomonadota bacterium]MBU1058271.1 hypothetical protein [Pseudomonadota bacterium]